MKFIKFIKNNLITCLCLLLASSVFLTGSISFARYASKSDTLSSPNAGSFICTAQVGSVSALSFTNTAFWGGTVGDDKIAMNALRAIDFSVYNYDYTDVNKSPSEVMLGYTLNFSAPQNFITKLAFQLFDDKANPLLPQVVVQDLFHAIVLGTNSGSFNTEDSVDYNATTIAPLNFNVNLSAEGVYTATSGDVIITLTPFTKQVQQTLNFRLWDTSKLATAEKPSLETEGGTLMPPLTVKFTTEVPCYKISIYMPQFKLLAGSPNLQNYTIKIAPTSVLEDDHLGGSFYGSDGNLITELYGGGGNSWTLKSTREKYTDTHYGEDGVLGTSDDDVDIYEQNVLGSLKIYNVGDEETITHPTQTIITYLQGVVGEGTTTSETSYDYVEDTDTSIKNADTMQELETNYPGIDPTESGNWYNRTYTYAIPISKDITETTVETEEIPIYNQTTTTASDVVETIKVDAVSPDGTIIEQTVTVETKINQSTSTTRVATKTITTTTTETKTVKGTRTCVFRRDRWGNENKGSDGVAWNGGGANDYKNLYNHSSSEVVVDENTVTVENTVDLPKNEQTTKTESEPEQVLHDKIDRIIERSFSTSSIIIDEVSFTPLGASEPIIYTEENKLLLFGSDGLQDYFLSQSYSKNYPFSVDVLFEQILE